MLFRSHYSQVLQTGFDAVTIVWQIKRIDLYQSIVYKNI